MFNFVLHYISLIYSTWQNVISVNLDTILIPYLPQKYKITGVMEKQSIFDWTVISYAKTFKIILPSQGHDTTSAAICWAFFLLGRHPDVQVM
jgi:hypothetical protein